MRYVAIDLGDQRTGLALGDSGSGIASPAGLIEVPIASRGGEQLLDAIAAGVSELLGSEGELVVGLPLNMDGSEGPRARLVRAFAKRLGERTGRVVRFMDERRTSVAAEARLSRSGFTHKQKKARRDAIAASVILEAFLAGERSGDGVNEGAEDGARERSDDDGLSNDLGGAGGGVGADAAGG